jgi:hypothetical protein
VDGAEAVPDENTSPNSVEYNASRQDRASLVSAKRRVQRHTFSILEDKHLHMSPGTTRLEEKFDGKLCCVLLEQF